MNRRYLVTLPTISGLILGAFAAPSYAQQSCQVGQAVIVAINSAQLSRNIAVTSGNIVVNNALTGPTLVSGFSLSIDRDAAVAGSIAADRINLSRDSTISGTASYNQLTNDGATLGGQSTPLLLPVFGSLPPFQEATFHGAVQNVNVASGATTVLAAGDYGNVVVGAGGQVIFSGGLYSLQSISASRDAKLTFNAASEVRVAGKFQTDRGAIIGPATGSGLSAASIVFYIGGINGTNGQLGSTPKAAEINRDSTVNANLYVPNGTLQIDRGLVASGAFFARDIQIERDGQLARASAFLNASPKANPQDLVTNGSEALVITLTALDPEGGDMTFAIQGVLQFPSLGSLGSVVEGPTPAPGVPPGCSPGDCTTPPVPPRSSATITYTPSTGANAANSFTFSATDACGNVGMATVRINPAGDTTNPVVATVVDATNVTVETATNTPRDVTLVAGAPPTATLTFSIESLPAQGGSLKDGSGAPIGSVPYTLPSRKVTYTPPTSVFTGSDTFLFKATGTVGGSDTASVIVNVIALRELAQNQSVTTSENTPIEISLGGNEGGTGVAADRPRTPVVIQADVLTGSTVAGNVSDATADSLGDERDNLPGPTPALVAAGVDVNLGILPSGTVSDPNNDATPSSNTDPDPDLVSAAVNSDGTNLLLQVRYKPGTFDSAVALATFVLDTDRNPATGHPGSDSDCVNDNGIIGGDFLVVMGAYLGATAQVFQYQGTCNSFALVGTGTTTYVTDGMDASVPLSALGGSNGRLNFKVTMAEQLGPNTFTGVLDYMPDVGLPAAQVRTGIQGVARVQIEWDISTLPNTAAGIQSAEVVLRTERGTVDSLGTVFFAGTAEQNGVLAVSDFQAPADPISGVTMPVPAGSVAGDKGTFVFDVTNEVKAARTLGRNFFSVQGRVNEGLVGGGFKRGLQIRSSATGNLSSGLEPKLEVITTGVSTNLTFTITSLPAGGTLRFGGIPVVVNQTFAFAPTLLYTPTFGVTGNDSFTFRVTQGALSDLGTVSIVVNPAPGNCTFNGRPVGCSPN